MTKQMLFFLVKIYYPTINPALEKIIQQILLFCLTDKNLKGFDKDFLTGLTGMILIDLSKALIQQIMKPCSRNCKQLDSLRKLYIGVDPIFLREYFLLILIVSTQNLEKFLVGYHKGLS